MLQLGKLLVLLIILSSRLLNMWHLVMLVRRSQEALCYERRDFCLCRPPNVQIADIVSYATYQASGTNIARVLAKQTRDHKA